MGSIRDERRSDAANHTDKRRRAEKALSALMKYAAAARRELRKFHENNSLELISVPEGFNQDNFLREVELLTRPIKRGRKRKLPGLEMGRKRIAAQTEAKPNLPAVGQNKASNDELLSSRENFGHFALQKFGRAINDREWAHLFILTEFRLTDGRFPSPREFRGLGVNKKAKTLCNKLSAARQVLEPHLAQNKLIRS